MTTMRHFITFTILCLTVAMVNCAPLDQEEDEAQIESRQVLFPGANAAGIDPLLIAFFQPLVTLFLQAFSGAGLGSLGNFNLLGGI